MKRNWNIDIKPATGTFQLNFHIASDAAATSTQSESNLTNKKQRFRFLNNKKENEVLMTIYNIFSGTEWTNSTNWCTDLPHSMWYGISTNKTGNITEISLSSNNMSGSLSEVATDLLYLKSLTSVDISNNLLYGCKTASVLKLTKELVWFDFSGNKDITTFWRFRRQEQGSSSSSTSSTCSSISPAISTTRICSSTAPALTKSKPLGYVHISSNVLTPETCASIVASSELHASNTSGWLTNRHHLYKTTDIDVKCSALLIDMCNHELKDRILPTIASNFNITDVSILEMDDLFVVKYEYSSRSSSKTKTQIELEPHRDDSILSFVVSLNQEYKGGGTTFVEHNPLYIAAPKKAGTMVSFCGKQKHAGNAITSGVRYILAGFVKIRDDKINHLLTSMAREMYPIEDKMKKASRNVTDAAK
jgi:hypothetical protein